MRTIWISILLFAVGCSSNPVMYKNRFSRLLTAISTKVTANTLISLILFVFPQFIFKYRTNSCYGYSLALEWIFKNGEVVVPVSTLTTIRGILSHLTCCNTKKQFVNGLLKGGGANLTSQSLIQFGQMVSYFSNWNNNPKCYSFFGSDV